jgi:hypothetical protein
VIAFTVLGVLVWLVACYRAGWWLGFALDVLLPIWALKQMDPLLSEIFAGYMEVEMRQ